MSTRNTPKSDSPPPRGPLFSFLPFSKDNLVAGVKNTFDFSQPSVTITRPHQDTGNMWKIDVELKPGLMNSEFYEMIDQKIDNSLENLKGISDTRTNSISYLYDQTHPYSYDIRVTKDEKQSGNSWTLSFYYNDPKNMERVMREHIPPKGKFPVLSGDGKAIEWNESTREFFELVDACGSPITRGCMEHQTVLLECFEWGQNDVLLGIQDQSWTSMTSGCVFSRIKSRGGTACRDGEERRRCCRARTARRSRRSGRTRPS